MATACLVFDLDDTLYLERDYVRSGFQAVGQWLAERFGPCQFSERAWRLFEDGRRGDIFDCVLREVGLPQSLVAPLVEVYRAHGPAISLPADAVSCLGRLADKTPLAMITDGNRVSQRQKLRALAIEPLFYPVVLTDEWGAGYCKPHPRAFRYVAEQLESAGARYIYVADNPNKDFQAPRALGWNTIRVRRPGGLHSAVESELDLRPDLEVANLEKLPEMIARLQE